MSHARFGANKFHRFLGGKVDVDSVEIVPRGVVDNNGEGAADHDGGMKPRVDVIFDFRRSPKDCFDEAT